MDKLNKRINLAINIAIVLLAVAIGILFARNYLLPVRSTAQSRDYHVKPGTMITLPDVDWRNNGHTLLLVLDKKCAFCTASASFYQQLVAKSSPDHRVKLIAVLPHEISESKQYLNDLNVPISEIRKSDFRSIGAQGTPTLILVDSNGAVERSWPGKLPPDQETEVLKQVE